MKTDNNQIKKECSGEPGMRHVCRPPADISISQLYGGKWHQARSAREGLEIPFALDTAGRPVQLHIGFSWEAHGFLTGSVGSGKSSLLHTLLLSAMMCYPPSELEIWYAAGEWDELEPVLQGKQVQVLHMEADSAGGASVNLWDRILEEMDRRRKLFVMGRTRNFESYREREALPRILVVIDDFWRVYQLYREMEDTCQLETIISEANFCGISILFCSRCIDRWMPDRILARIPVRVAMRNHEDKIKESLAVEYQETSGDLQKKILEINRSAKGVAIYGYWRQKADNSFEWEKVYCFCRAAYADPEDMERILAKIQKGHPDFMQQSYSSIKRD